MGGIGDTFVRLGRLRFVSPTTKYGRDLASNPFVRNDLGRMSIFPRMIFLQVYLLEFRDFVLCMISILRGRFLEIFLDPLSCLIFRFLPDRRIIRTGMPFRKRYSWLTFNVLRGLITSLSKISTKACWVLASATPVGSRPQRRMCKHIPLSRLSETLSHAALVVVGSARGSNEASTVLALRWSFRKEPIL
jgi:hypothetical protein